MQVAPGWPSFCPAATMDMSAVSRRRAALIERATRFAPPFICVLTHEYLGQGGEAGTGVYVGEDIVTRERYAIKRMYADDQATVEDIIDQYRHIHTIEHKNLVKCFGLELNICLRDAHMGQRDELWLIMELCQGKGNGPLFPTDKLLACYTTSQIRMLENIFRRCIVKEPENRPDVATLLIEFILMETRLMETEAPVKPCAMPDVDEMARVLQSMDITQDTDRSRFDTWHPTSFHGGGGLLCSVRSLLSNDDRMRENPFPNREVAKFRWLPYEHTRYVMVQTDDDKRFITEFIKEQPEQAANDGMIPFGVLVESSDGELQQHWNRANLRTGTLGALRARDYDTLIVWPNGAAHGGSMWTTKDQLVEVFSISAVQLVVIASKDFVQGSTQRSRWKELIQDAETAGRLIKSPSTTFRGA